MSFPDDSLGNVTQKWALSDIEPIVPENSRGGTEFLAHAQSAVHGECILKKVGNTRRFDAEVEALQHFEGNGAVKVYEADSDNCIYLMQALQPATQLSQLYLDGRDDEATRVIARLIKILTSGTDTRAARSTPTAENLLVHFERFKQRADTSEHIRQMVADGENAFKTMLAEDVVPVVLHGDLHHFNILQHGDDWLAIDPHGYIGPPIFEVGAMMKNPWPHILDDPDMPTLMYRRISILSEVLGWNAADISRSAFVYAVISLLWDMETNDHPSDFVPVVECLHRLFARP